MASLVKPSLVSAAAVTAEGSAERADDEEEEEGRVDPAFTPAQKLGHSPVKNLLQFLASERRAAGCAGAGDELGLYRELLDRSLNLKSSLAAVSILDDRNLRQFYRWTEPLQDPQFFSFKDTHFVLQQVASAFSVSFCVYQSFSGARARPSILLYDSRIRAHILDQDWPGPLPPPQYIFIVEYSGKHGYTLWRSQREENVMPCRDMLGEKWIENVVKPQPKEGASPFCYLTALRQLLLQARGHSSRAGPGKNQDEERSEDCATPDQPWSLTDLLNRSEDAVHSGLLPRCSEALLVAHLGTKLWTLAGRNSGIRAPARERFGVLELVGGGAGGSKASWDRIPVVCVRPEGGLYLLKEPFASHLRRPARPSPSDNPTSGPVAASAVSSAETDRSGKQASGQGSAVLNAIPTAPAAAKPHHASRPRSKEQSPRTRPELANAKEEEEEDGLLPSSRPCGCDVCLASKVYLPNMSKRGPQALYSNDYDLGLFFRIFGLWDAQAEARLQRCFHLSVASFDLESSTDELGGPGPGPAPPPPPPPPPPPSPPETCGQSEEASLQGRLAGPVLPHRDTARRPPPAPPPLTTMPMARLGRRVKVQRILMIGHVDGAGEEDAWLHAGTPPEAEVRLEESLRQREESMMSHVKIFSRRRREPRPAAASGDDPSTAAASCPDPVTDMVHAYATYLTNIRQRREDEKKRLMQPYLEVLAEYKQAHMDYFVSRDVDCEQARQQAWLHSLLGRFEAKLQRLIRTYAVFAFNASGYDLPLLAPSLVSSPALSNLRPTMSRRGTAVTRLTFSNGLRFHDVARMLSPGASLAKFAKVSGLTIVKSLLPYEKLDDNEAFLEEPRLPDRPTDYASSLSAQLPSQEEVNEALRDYEARGFNTVRDYLEYYLKKDCVMLQLSCLVYFDTLKRLTGVHPVEIGRFTLPSFSDYAGQRFLMVAKRIGCFSVNHTLMYSMLRRASVGGLSGVCRTAVNDGPGGDAPCNAHLNDADVEAEGVDARERERPRRPPKHLHYLDIASLYPASGESWSS